MRRGVLTAIATLGVAGCFCGTPYVELEPAVLDLRPPNMYMLVAPGDVGHFAGYPVEDEGNGNILIPDLRRYFELKQPARPFPLPRRLSVAGGMATHVGNDGEPHWRAGDIDFEANPPIYYEVLSSNVAEAAAPPDTDGPYVAAEVFGEVKVFCFTDDISCPGDHTGTFAVLVKWPDKPSEAVGPEARTARPTK